MSAFYQKAKESSYEDVKKQIEEASGKKLEDIFLGKYLKSLLLANFV